MSPILPTAQSRLDEAEDQQIKGLMRRKRIIMSVQELPFTSTLSPCITKKRSPLINIAHCLLFVINVRAFRPQSSAYQFLDRSSMIYLFL